MVCFTHATAVTMDQGNVTLMIRRQNKRPMSSAPAAVTKKRSVAYFNQSLKLDLIRLGRKRRQDYLKIFLNFQNRACYEKYLKCNEHRSLHWLEDMLRYFSLDIICSSKPTVFLELRSWKTVRF